VGELLPRLSILTVKRRSFSVALSLKSPSPGVTWHSCPVMLGLSSIFQATIWLTLFLLKHISKIISTSLCEIEKIAKRLLKYAILYNTFDVNSLTLIDFSI